MNGIVQHANKFDVSLVINFIIIRLLGNPPCPKSVIFGYQHFSYFRIVDSFANFICHKIRHKFIGFPINEHVSKISLPNTKSFSCISILVKCLAFFFCNLEGASWIYGVDKTCRGLAAKFKELGITCTYLIHFLFGNWSIMQGCAPIRPSLKYGKRFCSL